MSSTHHCLNRILTPPSTFSQNMKITTPTTAAKIRFETAACLSDALNPTAMIGAVKQATYDWCMVSMADLRGMGAGVCCCCLQGV